jgi:hypothetical protein
MRVRFLALAALTVGLGLVGATAAEAAPADSASSAAGASQNAAAQPAFFEADLSGANEVSGGAPGGTATGIMRLQGNQVTFAFRWSGITAPTLGHIHKGAAGVNGAVVVPFFGTAMPASLTAAAGSVTISDSTVADGIRANPAGFYMNLHTAQSPGGAVRGQLRKLAVPVSPLVLLSHGHEQALMLGANEVAANGTANAGDPNAAAVASIRAKDTQVGFTFIFRNLNPTLGHIHSGARGVNGPVVVGFFSTPVPTTIFAISGTVTGVDAGLVSNIAANPADFYANLHSAQFPAGAVRGQLFG